jgi:hypothetical protein
MAMLLRSAIEPWAQRSHGYQLTIQNRVGRGTVVGFECDKGSRGVRLWRRDGASARRHGRSRCFVSSASEWNGTLFALQMK